MRNPGDAIDRFGNKFETAFRKFIENCKEKGIFVVVDEAHHSPAYGCRNLLIGEKDSALGLRGLLPNLHLLGLTATPTYNDKSRRGWLWKIFENGIIYEANKASLITQKVLAKPNYIEVSTSKEWEVDDTLYEMLLKQHKDLPESIIEQLANNEERNNFIVQNYLENKDAYGKTIIFADRWFQCVYIKEKLSKEDIKADAIYSHIDADPGSAEARNKRTLDDNKRILTEFKDGKLDVLINVRMLTEGADVPNIQTVFITRQTTSSILMTQMIGRALRGEKVGGSSEANIVLFFDEWKRLIDWTNPKDGDTLDKEEVRIKRYYPLEYISIRLVEELSKSIEYTEFELIKFKKICPIGWYQTEIIYADSDSNYESMEAFTEFVMVYEHTEEKFKKFISFIEPSKLADEWSKNYLDNEWVQPQIEQWIHSYFDYETDNMGDMLNSDLIKIVRHIAQNQSSPTYHSFEERENYDLDKIANKVKNYSFLELDEYLTNEFLKPGSLWKVFYKSLMRFADAVEAAINNVSYRQDDRDKPVITIVQPNERELSEKEEIKNQYDYKCLGCGLKGKKGNLQIDHVLPFSMGGKTSKENSQPLCCDCNRLKGNDEIDFRHNITQVQEPKDLDSSVIYAILNDKTQKTQRILTRTVNFFYRCKAVSKVNLQGSIWEIHLYAGNNPAWLLQQKAELLKFIKDQLDYHVQDIKVTAIDKSE
ncbi:type III restriction enzyme res subunit [Nostoc carneum NIES-2107]|nr:type III restriction enzyme res subunit [Nostoc carneum NIES-2107]